MPGWSVSQFGSNESPGVLPTCLRIAAQLQADTICAGTGATALSQTTRANWKPPFEIPKGLPNGMPEGEFTMRCMLHKPNWDRMASFSIFADLQKELRDLRSNARFLVESESWNTESELMRSARSVRASQQHIFVTAITHLPRVQVLAAWLQAKGAFGNALIGFVPSQTCAPVDASSLDVTVFEPVHIPTNWNTGSHIAVHNLAKLLLAGLLLRDRSFHKDCWEFLMPYAKKLDLDELRKTNPITAESIASVLGAGPSPSTQ